MKHRPPFAAVLILILALAAGAYYFLFYQKRPANGGDALAASGTVETTHIQIAPEVAARVLEVKVSEADQVNKGDVLIILDGTLLEAQRAVALAAMESARTAAATAQEAAALEVLQAEQALKDLNENAGLARAKAQQNLANAQKALKDAKDERYKKNLARVTQATIDQARANLVISQDRLKSAEENYDKYDERPEDDVLRAQAFSALAAARQVVERNQWNLDWLLGLPDEIEVAQADAAIALAQANLDLAQSYYDELKSGPDRDALSLANARLQAAKVNLEAVRSAPAVRQAQANLDLVDAQISKLTITAPADGAILLRAVEPGEHANPGAALLILGRTADLTITVYIPEDRIGEISLGRAAAVSTDSFAGKQFSAVVTYMSDTAEFTPRNVQTVAGRKTTVFAVRLRVEDPQSLLKAGMPADVTFR